MDDFINSQIHSLERRACCNPPDPAHCLEIKRLARVSVAGKAGLAEGDRLVSADDIAATSLSQGFEADGSERRTYMFHAPAPGETVELTATGIDLGVKLLPTPQAAAAHFDPEKSDPELLEVLWEAGEWAVLERLSRAAVGERGHNTPALVHLGAARSCT